MTQGLAHGDGGSPRGCRRCGFPLDGHPDVVSNHVTSYGETMYSRCGACGLLQVWIRPDHLGAAQLVTRQPGR